jgi:uncharacterized SAM-binding protein YcdF (DUF218 family)
LNEIFVNLGIESWKALVSSLLLPPVPLLLLVLVGARMILWRRALGWLLVLLAVLGLWFGACSATGEWLQRSLVSPPPPLSAERIRELQKAAIAPRPSVAVVVLGGGSESRAPEYGIASLSPVSLERLRYGIWVSRETGAPMLFSGGLSYESISGASEAEIAADIAQREFGRSVRWSEAQSRDTRENAIYTAQLLRGAGIRQLVLVTHGYHMARAVRAFREASERDGLGWEIVPAPMGLAPRIERAPLRWIPSSEGFQLVRAVLREKLGWWFGA